MISVIPVQQLASAGSLFRSFGALAASRSLNSRLNYTWKCSIRSARMACNNSNNSSCDSRGAFIVLEGLDRSGKTSQSGKLLSYFEGLGHPAELWRFPDRTTSIGQMISAYLSNQSQLDDRAIHLLYSANRWEKRLISALFESYCYMCFLGRKVCKFYTKYYEVEYGASSLMESQLKNGTTLIVDRYSYSGVAFSSAKGLDFEWCKAPEIGLLAPDLVVYLDITPEKATERGGYGGERYEKFEFQKKVAHCYQALCDSSWKIIDACQTMEEVQKQLQEITLDHVMACKKGRPLSYLWQS